MEAIPNKATKPLRPFGAKDKWSYAMGDFGCNMSFALNAYLMLFYTQYIGLSLATWGIIILLLKIWDGINDPIMGGLMDSLKPGKRGKFKSYIYFGSFLLVVSGAMCFLPIPNAPYWVKILVCVAGYLVWDMSYTIVNVPYGAMNAAISADPIERAQLSTYRSIGAYIANVVIMVALPLFCYDKANNLIGNRLFIIALIMGVAAFFAFQILLRGTVERVQTTQTVEDKPKYNYWKAMASFLKNRAAVGTTIAAMASLIMMSGLTTATQILFQSFFQKAQMSGVISFVANLPMLLIIPFIKPAVKRFGKKEASSYPLLIGIVAALLMVLLPIKPDMSGLILWMALSVIISFSFSVFVMVGWAMVADCIDYQELKTGRREEGTVYATYSLGRKLAQGFGASIIAFLLLLTGYISENGAAQTMEVADNIRKMIGLVYFGGLSLMFVFLQWVYNLDKKTVEEMEQKLGHSNQDRVSQPDEEN
jgi:GPH family glycoside/pentoside/hexuronide:cation symporter